MPVEKKDYVASIYRYLSSEDLKDDNNVDVAVDDYQDEYADAVNDMAAWDFEQRGITGEESQ